MSVDAGDVIANALLASNIIQDITSDDNLSGVKTTDGVCDSKKLFSLNCEDGQVFYVQEDSSAGDLGGDGWSKNLPDGLGDCDLGIFGDGFQLCYVDVVTPGVSNFKEDSGKAASENPETMQEEDESFATSFEFGDNCQEESLPEGSGQEVKGPARWSQRQTSLFLSLLKRYESEFVCRLRPKCSILNSIARIMSATYKDVDKDLCYKKWSNLLRTYRVCKQNNKRGWHHFDDMERLSASVGNRGMTAKQIRERDIKSSFVKSSIRAYMDKTDAMQQQIHRSISGFQQKLRKLQNQSDEQLRNIFSILEGNLCEDEIQTNQRNETTCPLSDTFENTPHTLLESDYNMEVSDSHLVETQTQLIPERAHSPLSTSYSLFDFSTEIEIPILSNEANENFAATGYSDPGGRKSSESIRELAVNSGEKINDYVEYFMPAEHSWDSLNPDAQDISATVSTSPNIIPINAPSIEINEPVQLVPQSDGTFHFVSLPDQSQNLVSEHSHLFGSLKKITFTSNEASGQQESTVVGESRSFADLESELMERCNSTDSSGNGTSPTSESELVILSRSQLDNMNSIVPLETTAVALQLLPCSDDTFKLVVCPRENTEEEEAYGKSMTGLFSGSGNNTKNPESWSLRIFTPICPVVNIQSSEVNLNKGDDVANEASFDNEETETTAN